jgi:pimeloyl-ACP methyl ester carboxylesterase
MARYVLVHGAFGGAWCWEPVIPALEAAGHTVAAVDLPGGGEDQTPLEGITLASCADRVCDALTEPSILVGYSMGGIVITQAANDRPENVEQLVFVAAFMPSNGESLLDIAGLPEAAGDQIQANMVVSGDPPVAVLSDWATALAIYQRCTPEQRAWAIPLRREQAVAPSATRVQIDDELLARIPRSFVLTLDDKALTTAIQRRMIAEHPCVNVVELDCDHAPYLSATDELAAALLSVV